MTASRFFRRVFRDPVIRIESDIDEELRFHLEARAEELRSEGCDDGQARDRAAAELGDVTTLRASLAAIDHRVAATRRRAEWWESFAQDARVALRSLARTPSFTAAAVLTFALGIAISSVVVGAVDSVLWRPLPYPESDRLVALWETGPGAGESRMTLSVANLVDYLRDARSFSRLSSFTLESRNLTGSGAPQRVWIDRVSAPFLSVLGVHPWRGRDFRVGEDRAGGEPLAIVSWELWQELGADPSLLGGGLHLDGIRYTVIGILPRGFRAPNQYGFSEPIAAFLPAAYPPELIQSRGDHEVAAVARLAPGVSVEQAAAEMHGISSALAATYPQTNRDLVAQVAPLRDDLVRDVRAPLLVLAGAVALVFVVACINLATLLLVRAVSREREVAVRVALGASRRRVVQALGMHSALIAIAGTAVGLIAGVALRAALLRMAPAGIPRIETLALDTRTFVLTTLLAAIGAVLAAVVPAWRLVHTDAGTSLRSLGRSTAGGTVWRWRSVLVAAEIAFSVMLLAGAGLLVRSYVRVRNVNLGFNTARVLAFRTNLPDARYPDADRRWAFFTELEERLRAIPGVEAVGFANRLPMLGGWSGGFQIEHAEGEPDAELETDLQAVSAGYFATLGISLKRGRLFRAADRTGAPLVGVVNESWVRTFAPNGDALGIRVRRHDKAPWLTIVGVVSDIRRDGKFGSVKPEMYLAAAQTNVYPVAIADVAVRMRGGDPYAVLPSLRSAVWAIDSEQPITNVRSLDEIVSDSVAQQRFEATLLLLFATVGLVLAVIGTSGVISYAVAVRTREFGVRVALGAGRGAIVRLVVRQSSGLIAGGVALGLVGAFAMSRFLASLLFEIEPSDPPTFAAVAALLAAVGLVACWLPARRAARVDPVRALRAE